MAAFEKEKEDLKNYTNEFLKLFEEYRKENINIKKWISRFESTFKQVESLKLNIKKSIEEKDVFGQKIDDKDKEVFESLSKDLDTMKKLVVKILSQIEKEDPKISEFIGRISHDEISTAGFSFDLIKEYNKEKFLAVQEFVGLMPNFSKDLDGVIELPMIKMEDSAKHFEKFCKELLAVVKRVPSRGAMFESLGILLNYLIHYVGNVETLTQNDKHKFVGFISSSSSKKIANNFLDSMGSAHNIYDEFNKLLNSLDIKLSTTSNNGSTYNSLSTDAKSKVDKFTHSTLKVLFNGFTTKADKDILEIVNNKIYEADISDIQKEFNDKYVALVNSKFSKLSFNNKNSYENLFFICDGLDDYIDFKTFMKDKLKDKNLLINTNLYLSTLIESKEDKEPYKTFIKYNVEHGILLEKVEDTKEESKSEFIGDKIDAKNIVGAVNELIGNLEGQTGLILNILNEGDNFEGDSIKSEIRSNLNQILLSVSDSLNNVGLNLDTYRSVYKTGWSDAIVKNIKSEIKSCLDLLNGDLSSSQNINFLLSKIESILRHLK